MKIKRKPKSSKLQEYINDTIGDFGLAQFFITCVCTLPKISSGYCIVAISFFSYAPDWWRVRQLYNETTGNTTIYRELKKCPIELNDTVEFSQEFHTIVSEWKLICSDRWILVLIQTVQMAGVFIGGFLIGQPGDVYGRKRVLQISEGIIIFTMLAQAFSYHWQMFMVTSFFLGIGLAGFFLVINPYLIEFVSGKWRTILPVLQGFPSGIVLFGGLIYALPNWRHLCFASLAFTIPFSIISYFSPRSPRWLFTNNRIEEGKQVITWLATTNKRQEPTFENLDEIVAEEFERNSKHKSYNYLTLLKFPSTRKRLFLLGFAWFTQGFCFYVLTLGVGSLTGNIADNMMLMGMTGIVNTFIFYLTTPLFGRKYSVIIYFFVTSFMSFGITISYFAAKDEDQFKLTMRILAIASRLFIGIVWGSNTIYSAESFPTVIRLVGLSGLYTFARLGSLLAPQTQTLFDIAEHLPFLLNGVLTMVSGILLFFLPETYNLPIPDFIKEETAKETDCDTEMMLDDSIKELNKSEEDKE